MSESISRVLGPLGLCVLGVFGTTECGAPTRDFGPGMSTAAAGTLGSDGGAGGKQASGGGASNAGASTQGGSEAGAAGECADSSCVGGGNAGGGTIGGGANGGGANGGAANGGGAACGDTNSDSKNCGACGHDCSSSPNLAPGAPGVACQAGQCVIPDSACVSGKKHCTAVATDVCETDVTTAAKCGDCNTKCQGTDVCASGKCVATCPVGQTSCVSGQSSGCYDLTNSVDHCTSCATACTTTDPNATPKCTNNGCSYPCSNGYYSCGGVCVATNDPNHCGSCGNACSTSQTCVSGTCLVKDGLDCNVAGDCKSGVCTTFYQDADGDKQGAADKAKRVCGATPPAGYVTNADDCCDLAGGDGANIYKNNPNWYTKQTTSCNKGWDYDCSGNIEMEVAHIDSECKQNPVGQCTGFTEWSGSATVLACGASGFSNSCLAVSVPGGCASSMPAAKTQGCH
jgi:hypothetical protein